jgi:hypothetical protein
MSVVLSGCAATATPDPADQITEQLGMASAGRATAEVSGLARQAQAWLAFGDTDISGFIATVDTSTLSGPLRHRGDELGIEFAVGMCAWASPGASAYTGPC